MQGKESTGQASCPGETFAAQCENVPKTDGQTKAFSGAFATGKTTDGGRSAVDQCEYPGVGTQHQHHHNPSGSSDGADSGIEVVRALSSNGSNSDRFTPIQSCGSSLVSYSSEPEIDRGSECGSESSGKGRMSKGGDTGVVWKSKKGYGKPERSRLSVGRKGSGYDGEGTSESCSETSSTHEAVTPDQLSRSVDFKRSATSRLYDARHCESGRSGSGLRRSESVTRNGTYERPSTRSHSSVRSSTSSARGPTNSKSLSSSRAIKSGKCDLKGSKNRHEDGVWSSSSGRQRNSSGGARIRVSSVADPMRRSVTAAVTGVMSSSVTSSLGTSITSPTTGTSNALDKYGTLPRRPKKKSADQATGSPGQTSLARSNSVTREPSLNRTATLRTQRSKEAGSKSLPPYPKLKKSKTIIYHEVSVQTLLTSRDLSDTDSGTRVNGRTSPVTESKGIQTEGKERLRKLEDEFQRQSEELARMTRENERLRTERRDVAVKICKLLGSVAEDKDANGDGKCELEALEKHFQAVGLTVMKQQEELSELRRYKKIAHRDLEKSMAAQKNLLQQQQEIEEEYSELQEFLQAEKTALSESLLDTEQELKRLNSEIGKKETLLEQQQEECKHLVRICEQRRQENLSLEAKLAGVNQRSRDVLVQQGAAVSAAAVALSGLGARLDTLVEQLSVSCNITEKDLEDVVYHNEAYSQSEDTSPADTPSKSSDSSSKVTGSFLQVLLGAIRNATQSSFTKKLSGVREGSDRFFDAESSEPCLNLESSLDDNPSSLSNGTDPEGSTPRTVDRRDELSDVTDSYGAGLDRSDSLQNLSDAIINRQMVEKNEGPGSPDADVIPFQVNSLVDQIIDVDNLVTKLLKVIRIIQEESDKSVDRLRGESALLSGHLTQERLGREKLEANLDKVQKELTDARSQLNQRIGQLEEAKRLCGDSQRVAVAEMQKRFAVIDTALGALNAIPDMVNKCPPLAQLRQELQDFNYEDSVNGGDVNANSAASTNGNGVLANGAVLTTAI